MLLERLTDPFELGIGVRHLLLQLRHRFRRADAGDDIFALRVDQELAVELLRAVRRIARERDARARALTGVAVDHRLHVDGGAPLGRDVVLAAIDNCAVVHPRAEDGADGAHQLIPRRGREVLADALLHQRLEAAHELLQVFDRELRVLDVLVIPLVLQLLDDHLERLVVLVGALLHAEDDVAVHLDEAAVAVPREAGVAGLGGQRLDRLVVETEVEDRVHHAGHRVAGAGADRYQQWVLEIAKLLAGLLLDSGDAGLHLAPELGRIRALVGVEVRADLGRDREAGRHRQADAAHLAEVRALAAEQRLHRSIAIRLAAEEVHVLASARLRTRLRSRFVRCRLLRHVLRRGPRPALHVQLQRGLRTRRLPYLLLCHVDSPTPFEERFPRCLRDSK